MKHNLLWIGLSGVVLCASVKAAVGPKVDIYVLDPAITSYYVFPDAPLPKVCKATRKMQVFVSPGEYEPSSFVVDTAEPLEAVRVEVGTLTGPTGSLPAEVVDVRVVKPYYTNLPWGGAAAIPMLLLHDDSLITLKQDPEAKPGSAKAFVNVARRPLEDAPKLQPCRIDQRKQFWLTLHVPQATTPGSYRAPVRVLAGGAVVAELSLELEVLPIKLLPPMLEYSVYYPAYLAEEDNGGKTLATWGQLTSRQYRLETENMIAHGLDNPNIYSAAGEALQKVLELREQAGMRGKPLYLVRNPDTGIEEMRQEVTRLKQRGYPAVYFMGMDERWGNELKAERGTFEAAHTAGAKIFVACYRDFYDIVGDLLDCPVLIADLSPMEEAAKNLSPTESLLAVAQMEKAGAFTGMQNSRQYRRLIDNVHHRGNKIFCYMNPMAGVPFPELHRRNAGLGLWRCGFDGVMNWSYSHIQSPSYDEQPMIMGYVYRTEDGVLDTLNWEAFREAVDDVRYLTTLTATLARVAGTFGANPLVAETYKWLSSVDIATGNLNAIRREMANRIVSLSELGGVDLPPSQALKGADLKTVDVIKFPEPWRFRIDPRNEGVVGKWFAPTLDDSRWAEIRTDIEQGWNTQGVDGKDAVGYGWYRAPLAGSKRLWTKPNLYLHFGAVDEEAYVYLNGKLVSEHTTATTGMTPSQLWEAPFVVNISRAVNRKGPNQLTVRAHNSSGMGGIYRPVHLVTSPLPLTQDQIESLLRSSSGDRR